MGYDIVTGLKFAFAGLHDRQVQIWTLFYAAVLLAGALVCLALVLLIPMLIAADIVFVGVPASTIAAVVFAFLYILLLCLATLFFHFQFARNAMRLVGYEPKTTSFMQYFMVCLKTFVVNLFSWYDKRVLAVVVVLYAITVLWIAAGYFVHPLMVSAGFGILAFAIMVHYAGITLHAIRTTFAPFIYLRDGQMGPLAPKRSFGMVKGQTVDVLIPLVAGAAVFGMLMVPSAALAAVIIGYALLAAIASTATLYVAHVFRHFEQKGPSDKQKAQNEKGQKKEKEHEAPEKK